MSELFSVQMNIAEIPNARVEQSAPTSADNPSKTNEDSFNSILKQALPKDNKEKLSEAGTQTEDIDSPPDRADQALQSSDENDLKTDLLQLLGYLTQGANTESSSTTPTDEEGVAIDKNNLIDFLNTYFASDSTEDIQQTLKDIRTTLAQVSQPLTSPTNPVAQDDLTFGALTKNFGELQNLLTGRNGSEAVVATQNPTNISSQQQALLERLQSFIVNGQEAGTLSIKNIQLPDQVSSLRSPLSQIQAVNIENNSTETSSLIKGSGLTSLEDGMFAPTLHNRQQQLTGVRHDSTQHFYDAKTQPQNVLNESTNLADNQKGETMNQPGSGFSQMGSVSTSSENSGIFSMTNSTSLNPLTAQVTNPTTTMLPSGTIIQDQEVIQQLVERFQVNKRQQETKLQLKLHPVELGKMEIDLTVKEGSIRANVVAQSQHVQEILERNIAKLRSVLEQQGFNVEDITVTSSSETTSEFDLLQQHLNNGGSSSFFNNNDNSENHTPFVLDEFQDSFVETNTGVNVQA